MFSPTNRLGHASVRVIVKENDQEKTSLRFAHV